MALQFYLTDAGRSAAIDAINLDLRVSLSQIAVGSAKYNAQAAAAAKTALSGELARYPLNGGGVEPVSHTLRLVANIEANITANIFEVGLFTDTGVLFAIASTTGSTPLIQLANDIVTIVTISLLLADLDISNVQVSIDPNTPVSVALMNQHLAHQDPHPQYAKKVDFDAHVAQNQLEHNNILALLTAEGQARANADNAEAATRYADDQALGGRITNETNARQQADNELEADTYALSVATENALEQERQIRAAGIQAEINDRASEIWRIERGRLVFIANYLQNTPYVSSDGAASGVYAHSAEGYAVNLYSCLTNPYLINVTPMPDYSVNGITLGQNTNKTGFLLKFIGFIQLGCYAEQGDTSWSGFSAALRFYDESNFLLVELPLNLIQVAGGFTNNSNVGHVTYRIDNDYDLYPLFKSNGFIPNELRMGLKINASVNSDGGSAARSVLAVEKFSVRCVQ